MIVAALKPMSGPMSKNGASQASQPVLQLMTITPALAAEWLDSNFGNRSVSQNHVERLGRSMKMGLWQVTADTIKFDSGRRLRDGQHRLWAVVESECTIQSWVAFGISDKSFDVIDTGRPRYAKDVLSIHEFKSSTALAAACRTLIIWERTGTVTGHATSGMAPSNPEVLDYAITHPDVEIGVQRALKVRSGGIPGGGGMWGALLTIFGRIDDVDAQAFTDHVADGANLSAGDAILLLRNRLLGQRDAKAKLDQIEVAALVVKAWNAFRDRKPVQILRWTRGGATPEEFPEAR